MELKEICAMSNKHSAELNISRQDEGYYLSLYLNDKKPIFCTVRSGQRRIWKGTATIQKHLEKNIDNGFKGYITTTINTDYISSKNNMKWSDFMKRKATTAGVAQVKEMQ